MHNIHNLESRWLKYKIKLFLPYIIIFLFSIILIITLYFILDSKEDKKDIVENSIKKQKALIEKKEELINEKNTSKKEKKIEQEVKEVVIEKKTVEHDQKTILTPSLDFMKKLRTDSVHSYDPQETQQVQRVNKEQSPQEEIIVENDIELKDDTKVVQKPKIDISRKEDRTDLQDVIKRFKKNNNPALSLFVAKKYYKFGDYQKAYNYSLITNEINNEIEDSWIIFAKSLVKLNKRKKAIQTLTKYVKHSGSGNAKVLLDDIKSGKFK